MRFWIVKAGEPVPFLSAESRDRVWRAGLMSLTLAERGHEVVLWASLFDHIRKRFRDVAADRLIPAEGSAPHLVFLSSPGYRRNIGLRRIWDHNRMAARFRALAPQLPRPDAIVAAYPTVDLACASVDFGGCHGIPVVVDVRDLWPDIIYDWLNRRVAMLRVRTNGILLPYERMARRSFRAADSVIGVSQGMLDWAVARFGRPPDRQSTDQAFHQSKRYITFGDAQHRAQLSAWAQRGVDLSDRKIRLVWAGSMTPESDGATLLDALEQIPIRERQAIQVVICGTGSLAARIEEMANNLGHVTYAGWVDQEALAVLLEHSHIGLMCYLDRFDFQASIPNKVADYCAGGVRILTNLTGEIARLTKGTDTLIYYPTGDSSALANVLVDIARNPVRYRVDHGPAREMFARLFDADKVMGDFARHVESLAVQGSRPERRA